MSVAFFRLTNSFRDKAAKVKRSMRVKHVTSFNVSTSADYRPYPSLRPYLPFQLSYVKRYYQPHSIIVFDGYPEDATMKSTKCAERLRRQQKQSSVDFIFDITMRATVSQEKFLTNDSNKSRLITLLSDKLQSAGLITKQAYEDADHLIVTTAMEVSQDYQAVFIIGEDIDLLVLLTALNPVDSNIFFCKPSKGKVEQKIFSTNSFKYPAIRQYLLFIHAFSGCDTTSAFYGMGKAKHVKILEKDKDLQIILTPFIENNSHIDHLDFAGQKFIAALYGAKKEELIYLHQLRFQCFAKAATKTSCNIASLPPTREAARQHSLRVYHQIQAWSGNHLIPLEWGWKQTVNGLLPIPTTIAAAPQELLKTISCKCLKGCTGNCGCKKIGLHCSILCSGCQGTNYFNTNVDIDIDEEVDELIDIDVQKFLYVQVSEESASESESVEDIDGLPSPAQKKRKVY